MDFKKLKQMRQQAQTKGRGNPNIISFKDDETVNVRLVPNQYALEDQFISVHLLYGGGGVVTETSYSPKTFGEECPLDDFVNSQLNASGRVSTEKFRSLMSMKSSQAWITTAVVRGKEDEGTKWLVLSDNQFLQMTNQIELAMKEDKEFSCVDPVDGFDLTVTVTAGDKKAKKPRSYSYSISRIKTALAKDENQMVTLMEDQPHWEEIYPKLTPEEVIEKIKNFYEMSSMVQNRNSATTPKSGRFAKSQYDDENGGDDEEPESSENASYDNDSYKAPDDEKEPAPQEESSDLSAKMKERLAKMKEEKEKAKKAS